jgi:hypothetical protein
LLALEKSFRAQQTQTQVRKFYFLRPGPILQVFCNLQI